jgi:riboflavin transporter FmnP
MKQIINYFFSGFSVMFILTFILGSTFNEFSRTGVWYNDILGYIKHYVLWILPYWWLVIIIGSVVLGLLFWVIKTCVTRLRS